MPLKNYTELFQASISLSFLQPVATLWKSTTTSAFPSFSTKPQKHTGPAVGSSDSSSLTGLEERLLVLEAQIQENLSLNDARDEALKKAFSEMLSDSAVSASKEMKAHVGAVADSLAEKIKVSFCPALIFSPSRLNLLNPVKKRPIQGRFWIR